MGAPGAAHQNAWLFLSMPLLPLFAQAWQEQHCAERRFSDISACIIHAFLSLLIVTLPQEKLFLRGVVGIVAFRFMTSACCCYVAWRQPTYWLKHRALILTAWQILQLLVYYVRLGRQDATNFPFPLTNQTGWGSMVAFLSLPLAMARVSTEFILPFRYHRIVSFVTFAFAALLVGTHCQQDTGAEGPYRRIVRCLSRISESAWLPFPFLAQELQNKLDGATQQAGVCMVVHVWLGYVVGVSLPSAIIYAEEGVSRSKFVRQGEIGTGFHHALPAAFLHHLALVPFQAIVALQALMTALYWYS
jgi:hypothetical protein